MALGENEQGFLAGGLAGAGTGASIGAVTGSFLGPPGTVAGAAGGAAIGFIAGGLMGNMQAQSSRSARRKAQKQAESARRESIIREFRVRNQAENIAMGGLVRAPSGRGNDMGAGSAARGFMGENLITSSGTF